MRIRKLHKTVGICFAPFFLITALTGIALLWRKAGVYGSETKGLLLGLHNWEIAAKYVGLILALGLLFMTVTGLIIAIRTARKKKQP